MTALKKFSDYPALVGAALRGDETLLLADTASAGTVTAATISATAATDTISDSNGGLPVIKPGAWVLIGGFTDTAAELNGLHTCVTSDANNLVIATDITVDEAAGASVTVSEIISMYQISATELANFISAAGLPDPIVGSAFKDSREKVYAAASSSFDVSNGNMQTRTAAGNETIEVTLAATDGSFLFVKYIPGANTISFGTSIDQWTGGAGAPSGLEAEHLFLFFSFDGGATVIGHSIGAAS